MTDLTRQLKGKQIEAVLTNGSLLCIRTADGGEVYVKMVNDNGDTVNGTFVVGSKGFRLRCRQFSDIVMAGSLGLVGRG